MVDTVATLATNYGQERQVNDIGFITMAEAKTALRLHKGNIWAAVTECVEQRQRKVRLTDTSFLTGGDQRVGVKKLPIQFTKKPSE